MFSPEYWQVRATLVNDRATLGVPLAVQRQEWEDGVAGVALPAGVAVEPAALGDLPGEWVRGPAADGDAAVLLVHGGGFSAGSCRTHRELAARLSLASGVPVLTFDYRLAPEHPFPAALDDTVAAYRALLARGIAPARIVIAGDSAGGGLALSALLRLRDEGEALPAAAALISPWADLALAGETMETRADADPLCSREGLALAADTYLAGADARAPLASPVYADLAGLPPLLIHAGGDEILLSDATRLAERAADAGVDATLDVAPGLWHVWHGWAGALPEAAAALERIGAFVRACVGITIERNAERSRE